MTTAPAASDIRTDQVRATGWHALGCRVELLTRGAGSAEHAAAADRTAAELTAIDRAASRFRADSELTRVNARPEVWHPVSALFLDLLEDCLHAARRTDGLVVPTLGRPLVSLGYDRDLTLLPVRTSVRPTGRAGTAAGSALPADRPPVDAWREIETERVRRGGEGRVRIPAGIALDLGSVGKASGADRIARLLAADVLAGADLLVNLGGDIATVPAGPEPVDGRPEARRWEIGIDESGRERSRPPRTSVRIADGGLATSSTAVRVWSANGVRRHHILDPRTGLPAQPHWRCVSVFAADCRAANAASTAAVVLGPGAPGWLASRGFAARLVPATHPVDHPSGPPGRSEVAPVRVGGWPADVRPAPSDRPEPDRSSS